MEQEKKIKIPQDEIGMSGYSKLAWKLYDTGKFSMAKAELADRVMREQGYRKQIEGEWILLPTGDIKCSVEWCGFIGNPKWAHNFCPNCGAKMTAIKQIFNEGGFESQALKGETDNG